MLTNITKAINSLNVQFEVITKLKMTKSTKITKTISNKIDTFNDAYSQITKNTSSEIIRGNQAYNFYGDPMTVKINATDANSETGKTTFVGIQAVVSYGDTLAKEIANIK